MIHYAQQAEKKETGRGAFYRLKKTLAGGGSLQLVLDLPSTTPVITIDDPFERVRQRLRFHRGENVLAGKVIIAARGAKHTGITIEHIGLLTIFGAELSHHVLHREEETYPAGTLDTAADTTLSFRFTKPRVWDSYRGVMGKLSYVVRAKLHRGIAPLQAEEEVWVLSAACELPGTSEEATLTQAESFMHREETRMQQTEGVPRCFQRLRVDARKRGVNAADAVAAEALDSLPIPLGGYCHASSNASHLMIGIPNKLQIEVQLERDHFAVTGVVHGMIRFVLSLMALCYCELRVVRFETHIGDEQDPQVREEHTMQTFELMDGSPCEGEVIPIRFPLACVPFLSPTYASISETLSITYALKLMLLTTDGYRLFKDLPVVLYREKTPESQLVTSGVLGMMATAVHAPSSPPVER